jgi:hypothetical protein
MYQERLRLVATKSLSPDFQHQQQGVDRGPTGHVVVPLAKSGLAETALQVERDRGGVFDGDL